MANDARLEVRIPRELLERLPAGGERSVFVRRALEAALGDTGRAGVAGPVPSLAEPVEVRETVVDRASAASPRASVPPAPLGEREPLAETRFDPPRLEVRSAPSNVTVDEGKPTVAQLVGWSQGALTSAAARRALEDGSWRNFRKYRPG